MNGRTVTLTIAAFVLGALAAGSIGVRVIREVRTDEDATSLPPSVTATTLGDAPTYQVDPSETLIGSSVLVPGPLESVEGEVRIPYSLVSLAPRQGVEPLTVFGGFGSVTVIEPADFDHVYPKQWNLATTGGDVDGGPANQSVRVARFSLASNLAVEEAEITEALVPMPFRTDFTVSSSEPTVQIHEGLSVELLNVSEQGETTIVQVAIDAEQPEDAHVFVAGRGPGWRSAVFEAEGRPRVNLTWVAGPLPAEIPLTAEGTLWATLDGDFAVATGATP